MLKEVLPGNIQGTKDFYGLELDKLKYIIEIITDVFEKFGYNELQTPSFESIDLLKKTYGDDLNKLIYRILNSGIDYDNIDLKELKNSKDGYISKKFLIYDLTLPLIRYVYNNRTTIRFPFKRYQIQKVWRADRPQKGRYREFYQCDVDILGSDSLLCELEQIQIIEKVLCCLGIINYKIKINSRKIVNDICTVLNIRENVKDLCIILDKIDKIGIEETLKEVEKKIVELKDVDILGVILESKNDIKMLMNLFEQKNISTRNLQELQNFLDLIKDSGCNANKIDIDFSLVRGLDYYTGIIYEVVSTDVNIGSIAGGGRYGYFSNLLQSKELNGVGVSFGLYRLYTLLEEMGLFRLKKNEMKKILISNLANGIDFSIVNSLRNKYIVEYNYKEGDDLKKQLRYANKLLYDYILIGREVKDLSTGNQFNVSCLK